AYQKDLTSFETVINKLPLSFFDPFGHLAILEHYKNKGDLELAQSWFRVCEEAVNVHFSQAYLKQLDRLHQKTNFLSKQWKLQQLKLELDRQWDWLYTAQNKNILSLKSQAGLYTLAGLAALLFLSFLVYFFQKQAFQKKLHVAQLAKTERDGALHIEKENQEALEFTQNLSQKTILPFIQRASNKLFEDFEPHKHEQLLGIKAAIDSEIQALNNALSTAGISDKKRWDIFQTEFPTNPALHFQDVSNCNWPSHTSGLLKELSTNSLKHANCSRIDIQLMQLEKDFIISYQDNGKGLDPNNSKGIGLTNMHQTVSNIGGKIELHWKGGFNAKIHIPL
ncbi:MAG: C4-dicarboxylate-specific signal transduction histidine kinase, partial [Luteibaculaceae bacterium]